jgi:hypothetical protein
MKWKLVKARTTKVNRTATRPRYGLEHYCRDPERLAALLDGAGKRSPPGEQLIALFRPFLEYLAGSDLAPKTIQKHVDNVWVLGGEFIRDLNYDPSLRKKPVDLVLRRMIGSDGGPLLYHGGEDEQRSFDSTCRKLRRFLAETAR